MADVNHVILIGRLTRDSELKYTSGGMAVNKFAIAVNRRRKKGDSWVEEASFFDIILWGRAAETLQQYLVKGKQVAIEGELRQNRWEQDGQSFSKIEIMAQNVQLLGGHAQSGNSQGGNNPAGNSQNAQASSGRAQSASNGPGHQNANADANAPTGNHNPGQGDLSYDDDMSTPPDFPDDIPF
jgi:single-strand DNA-binding protein